MGFRSVFRALFENSVKWRGASELWQRRRIATFNMSQTFLATSSCCANFLLLVISEFVWKSKKVGDSNSIGLRTKPSETGGSPNNEMKQAFQEHKIVHFPSSLAIKLTDEGQKSKVCIPLLATHFDSRSADIFPRNMEIPFWTSRQSSCVSVIAQDHPLWRTWSVEANQLTSH